MAVRTASEMEEVLARNPFSGAPGNRTVAIFLNNPPSPDCLDGVVGRAEHEAVELGRREIYVRYGADIGRSKLRIPAARYGTVRNMNTVAKLARMAEASGRRRADPRGFALP